MKQLDSLKECLRGLLEHRWPKNCARNIAYSLIVFILSSQLPLYGEALQVPDECSKEELMKFFPHKVVQNVLLQAKISEEKSEKISHELSEQNSILGKIVKNKAEKLNKNSLKDLSQRDLVLKIYRETLYEIFSKILMKYGINDEEKIQELFERIREAKSKLFIECIRKQQ